MHFKFGITITISKEKKIGEYILRLMIKTQENQVMNCYHFILNINREDTKRLAKGARSKNRI